MDTQDLANLMLKQFEQKKRDNGNTFYCLKDEAPDWMTDVCRTAHENKMPDDWTYSFIYESLQALSDSSDMEPDIYNHELLSWLAESGDGPEYVERYEKECGGPFSGFMDRISAGQLLHKNDVFWRVESALEEQAEKMPEESEA